VQMAKRQTKPKDKLGRSDRYPSDYGVRDSEREDKEEPKKKSWVPGDKGQGREGFSKGYGGSEGKGHRSFRPRAQVATGAHSRQRVGTGVRFDRSSVAIAAAAAGLASLLFPP